MINDVSLEAGNVLTRYLHEQLDGPCRSTRATTCSPTSSVAEITDETAPLRKLTAERERRRSPTSSSARAPRPSPACSATRRSCSPRNPDQRAELAADAALIPNAVEELLRFEAPSPVQGRWTTRDVELHGEVVPGELEGAAAHRRGRARRAQVPRRRPLRHPPRRSTTTWRSGTASTSASAPRWPASRAASGSRRRCGAIPTWEVDHDRVVRLHTSTVRGYSPGADHGRRAHERSHRAGRRPETAAVAAARAHRRAERARDRARRSRVRAARLLRLRHRDAEHRRAGRGRPALQPVPRHRAVLADPRRRAHRAQPPRGRHGDAARARGSVRGLQRRASRSRPRPSRVTCATTATRRTPSASGTWRRARSGARRARSTAGRSASASNASTASSAATRTSGRRS